MDTIPVPLELVTVGPPAPTGLVTPIPDILGTLSCGYSFRPWPCHVHRGAFSSRKGEAC